MLEQRIGKRAQVTHAPFHPADVRTNQADVTEQAKFWAGNPREFGRGGHPIADWYMQERIGPARLKHHEKPFPGRGSWGKRHHSQKSCRQFSLSLQVASQVVSAVLGILTANLLG